MGRGHPVRTVREVGLQEAEDAEVAEYALAQALIVVTFDSDFRSSVLRHGARCLHIHPREATARERLKNAYDDALKALQMGCHLVSVDAKGNVTKG
jgi:predicted nuclease of predicted toxin-antitoxin system